MEQDLIDDLLNESHQKSNCTNEELDSHVITYLGLMDEYIESYEELKSQIKEAFFNLTKAKMVLGPLRISPNSYDSTAHRPIKTIIIQDGKEQNDQGMQVHQSKFQAESNFKLSSMQLELPSLKIPEQLPSDGVTSKGGILALDINLRKRKPTPFSESTAPPKSEETQEKTSDEETERARKLFQDLPDPIHQFSALPPPSLRFAQSGFSKTLEIIVKLSNLRLSLLGSERQIQSYKLIESLKL